jgi:hypothetical protein
MHRSVRTRPVYEYYFSKVRRDLHHSPSKYLRLSSAPNTLTADRSDAVAVPLIRIRSPDQPNISPHVFVYRYAQHSYVDASQDTGADVSRLLHSSLHTRTSQQEQAENHRV